MYRHVHQIPSENSNQMTDDMLHKIGIIPSWITTKKAALLYLYLEYESDHKMWKINESSFNKYMLDYAEMFEEMFEEEDEEQIIFEDDENIIETEAIDFNDDEKLEDVFRQYDDIVESSAPVKDKKVKEYPKLRYEPVTQTDKTIKISNVRLPWRGLHNDSHFSVDYDEIKWDTITNCIYGLFIKYHSTDARRCN